MSDRSIGDFARALQHDPREAARLLLASAPAAAVARLVDALEEEVQGRDGWRLNNRQVVDNITDPGQPFPVVSRLPGVVPNVSPPRPEVKHLVRSTVWVRPHVIKAGTPLAMDPDGRVRPASGVEAAHGCAVPFESDEPR